MWNNFRSLTSLARVNYATEGGVDAAVAERLILYCGASVGLGRVAGGKSKLDPNISRYVESANSLPWLIIRDLDHDATCAPELRTRLSQRYLPLLCLRIAVREIESWLLADRHSISTFLRVRVGAITTSPEDLPDPKGNVVNLARRSSSRAIRAAMVPEEGVGASEGPEYAAFMTEFARKHWDVPSALSHDTTSSLNRAVRCLERIIAESDRNRGN